MAHSTSHPHPHPRIQPSTLQPSPLHFVQLSQTLTTVHAHSSPQKAGYILSSFSALAISIADASPPTLSRAIHNSAAIWPMLCSTPSMPTLVRECLVAMDVAETTEWMWRFIQEEEKRRRGEARRRGWGGGIGTWAGSQVVMTGLQMLGISHPDDDRLSEIMVTLRLQIQPVERGRVSGIEEEHRVRMRRLRVDMERCTEAVKRGSMGLATRSLARTDTDTSMTPSAKSNAKADAGADTHSNGTGSDCSICQDEMVEPVRLVVCGHLYCRGCIGNWVNGGGEGATMHCPRNGWGRAATSQVREKRRRSKKGGI
ncbi:hypothetical protein BCR34DRAFT_652227 [Clohesyomyces aquaticus]|uniref:RING-type domain-containing protein n=1 Tax=Clohesyomyces aquaticus TaxID=1231657 RepID=A0A1Y1ZNB2_9PLEO|nr:hypothetical protein BCR34DRAFT_652227 [Clohesyomyces aquaticus]